MFIELFLSDSNLGNIWGLIISWRKVIKRIIQLNELRGAFSCLIPKFFRNFFKEIAKKENLGSIKEYALIIIEWIYFKYYLLNIKLK